MDKANARNLIEYTITMCIMTSVIQTAIPNLNDLFLVAKNIHILGVVELEDLVAIQVGLTLYLRVSILKMQQC